MAPAAALAPLAASQPLFVVGVWRSGTSLLYALLNQHPEIALLYEGDLPLFWPLFVLRRRDWAARWDFWNSSLRRHALDDVKQRFQVPADAATATGLAYREYAASRGATVWGDKSPTYHRHLGRLAEVFPQARFLIIWRNPVAICRSIAQASRTAPWFRRRGTMLRALLGCERLKRDCERLKRRGHSVHELTYGQLTANPQETCAAICRFLEIPYDARMASLDGADRSAVYEGEHHARLRSEAIRPSNAPADALAPAMKAKIDRYLAGWAASEGDGWLLMRDVAPPASSPPSIFERIADRLAYACLRGWDATVMTLYCFAPLRALQFYRDWKSRSISRDAHPEEPRRSSAAAD